MIKRPTKFMGPKNVLAISSHQVLILIKPVSVQCPNQVRTDVIFTGESGFHVKDVSLGRYFSTAIDSHPSHKIIFIRLF